MRGHPRRRAADRRSSARSTTCTTCRRRSSSPGSSRPRAIPVAGRRARRELHAAVRRLGRPRGHRAAASLTGLGDRRGDERRQLHRRRRRPGGGRLHDLGRPPSRSSRSRSTATTPASSPRSRRAPRSGFLWHNFHPASVFMGDAGSNLLGLLLACIAVQGVLKTAAVVALFFPLVVLAVPILDTAFVVAKRFKYRRPAWEADTEHFHHRMARIGFSQRRTVLYLYLWTLVAGRAGARAAVRAVLGRPRQLRHRLDARDDRLRRARGRGERLPGLRARDPQVPALPRAPAREAGGHHAGGDRRGDRARDRDRASSRRSSSTS